jgi:hypothetical protein
VTECGRSVLRPPNMKQISFSRIASNTQSLVPSYGALSANGYVPRVIISRVKPSS